jgi:predicted dehydrogenase
LALVGFGNHVLSKHLPNIKAMPDVEMRGIASATARNASVVAGGLGATMITTDVEEVVADPGADVVMTCSSQPEHFEHMRTAI